MSLSRLVVRGFQVHRRLAIRLGRITSIIGRTDVGKSAVLRAIWWLCTNRPAGRSFVSRGEDRAVVRLEIGKRVIRRIRAARRNVYELDGRVLEGFASGVPEDVAKALNISDLSYQRQHDGPFWIGSSAAEVSRQVNEIVDLAVIDRTLSRLGAVCRLWKAKGISLRSLVREQKALVIRLGAVRSIDKSFRDVERIAVHKKRAAVAIEMLTAMVLEAEGLEDRIQTCQIRLRTLQQVQKQGRRLETVRNRYDSLASIIQAIEQLEPLLIPPPNIELVESTYRSLKSILGRYRSIFTLINQCNSVTRVIAETTAELNPLEKRFAKGVRVCPLCGRAGKATQAT